jgi:hypothetical protein
MAGACWFPCARCAVPCAFEVTGVAGGLVTFGGVTGAAGGAATATGWGGAAAGTGTAERRLAVRFAAAWRCA